MSDFILLHLTFQGDVTYPPLLNLDVGIMKYKLGSAVYSVSIHINIDNEFG